MKNCLAAFVVVLVAVLALGETTGSDKLSPKFAVTARRAVLAIRDYAFTSPKDSTPIEIGLAKHEAISRRSDAEAEVQTAADQHFMTEAFPELFSVVALKTPDAVKSCSDALVVMLKGETYTGLPGQCSIK